MKWWSIILLFLLVIGYMSAGTYLFIWLEESTDLETRLEDVEAMATIVQSFAQQYGINATNVVALLEEAQPYLSTYGVDIIPDTSGADSPALNTRWTIEASFSMVTSVITTIGYGDITPMTSYGRLAVIYYGLFGIPLLLTLLSQLGRVVGRFFRMIDRAMKRCIGDDSKCAGFRMIVVTILFIVFFYISFVLIPAAVLSYVVDFDLGEAHYFTFITFTTIGFGDFVMIFNETNEIFWNYLLELVWLIYVCLGLAYLSSILTIVGDWQSAQAERIRTLGIVPGAKKLVYRMNNPKNTDRESEIQDGFENPKSDEIAMDTSAIDDGHSTFRYIPSHMV